MIWAYVIKTTGLAGIESKWRKDIEAKSNYWTLFVLSILYLKQSWKHVPVVKIYLNGGKTFNLYLKQAWNANPHFLGHPVYFSNYHLIII